MTPNPRLLKIVLAIVLIISAVSASRAEQFVWAPQYLFEPPYYNFFPVEFLQDVNFNNGFRAFASCKTFEGDSPGCSILAYGHTGNCIDYKPLYVNNYPGRNFAVHTWPDTGAPNDIDKFWSFNEGDHFGITEGDYTFPPNEDLAVHRLEANQETNNDPVLIAYDDNVIWLQAWNNLTTPNNSRILTRTVSSDRHGKLYMYANTANEIHNTATDNSNSADTWPHFILEQNFKDVIDMAMFNEVNVSAWIKIPSVQPLTTWSGYSNATCTIGVALRRKDNPCAVRYIGYVLYSSANENQRSRPDQNGTPFYDGDNWFVGGPIIVGQPERQISFDLRELMVAATAADPATFGPIDDYYLTGFGFGWEIVGHYDFSSEIFRVSVAGWPKTIMDSEVYNDQVYKIYNSFPPDDQWSPGMRRAHWTKWGAEEGWPASQTFDVKIYMDRWGNPADPGSGSYYNFMPQCYNGDGSRNYPCAIVDYVWNGRPDHPGHW